MIETTANSTSLTFLSHSETSHVMPSKNRSESQPILISCDHFSDNNSCDEIKSLVNVSKTSVCCDNSESNGTNGTNGTIETNGTDDVTQPLIKCLLCPMVSAKQLCQYFCQIPACICLSSAICLFCGCAARIRCKWLLFAILWQPISLLASLQFVYYVSIGINSFECNF